MKLSIVIPAFNVRPYIDKCVSSCALQDVSPVEYEIVIVNDGSTDGTEVICKDLSNLYSNVKIINQTNQGLSAARNNGFSFATGQYVWFVDSDDYIEANSLSRIFGLLENEVDIIQLKYRLVYEDNRPSKDVPCYYTSNIMRGKQVITLGGLPAPAQFCIYRSDFLRSNKLEFFKGIYHEDSEFKPRATYLAESIIFDDVVSYNYLQRLSGSITSVFNLKRGLDILIVVNKLHDFVLEKHITGKARISFYRMISMNLNSLFYGYHLLGENDKKSLLDSLYSNKSVFVLMLKSCRIKYCIEGIFFIISPRLGFRMYNFFNRIKSI